jgi:hypothetical protein
MTPAPDGGFPRTLPKGGVLWWEGDPATSVAVVESGCLGVRSGGRLIDIALPGTVLGEASLLPPEGTQGRRTADVVALEPDSAVLEHPALALREPARGDVRAIVLRTLLYQVARNVILVRAAHPEDLFVRTTVDGLMETAARAHARVRGVTAWDDFVIAFRLAYRLREGSDVVREELAPAGRWTPTAARAELQALRAGGFESELATAVDGFLVLWSSLPPS